MRKLEWVKGKKEGSGDWVWLDDHKCEIWFVQTFTAQTNEEE